MTTHDSPPFDIEILRRNKQDEFLMADAYFLHFMGIANKTQPELQRFKEVPVEDLVLDDSHVKTHER